MPTETNMHNTHTRASVNPLQLPTASVLRVDEGRGFIVEHREKLPPEFRRRRTLRERLVITGAHCLPNLPPAHPFSYLEDRIYRRLLRSLDGSKKDVWAQCLFVDPVADIAVLGSPDNQDLGEQADAYDELTGNIPALRMAAAQSGPGWVLALDNRWVPITIEVFRRSLRIDATEGGQSGSPILDAAGRAVGVIVMGSEANGKNQRAAGQSILARNLPAWLAPRSR